MGLGAADLCSGVTLDDATGNETTVTGMGEGRMGDGGRVEEGLW